MTPVNNLPPNLTSIAGNPGGGFWLTDGFGSIYFLEQNGTCTEVANVQLKRVSKSTIYSWDGFVLWVGVCEHSTKAGTDLINVAIFFSQKRGFRGELKQLGRRFFEVSDGLFQVATYHPVDDILWLIWQSSSRYHMAAKVGYPLDFINNKETEIPISGIDHNLSKITISSDATGLYCLSENGNLFRLNAQTMQVQAVLSGNRPIETMVNSFGHEEILYLALKSHSQVATCKFIGEVS